MKISTKGGQRRSQFTGFLRKPLIILTALSSLLEEM